MGLRDRLDASLFFGEIRKVFRVGVFEGDQLPGAQMGGAGFGRLLLSDNGSRQNERSRNKCDWSSFHGVCDLNFVAVAHPVNSGKTADQRLTSRSNCTRRRNFMPVS